MTSDLEYYGPWQRVGYLVWSDTSADPSDPDYGYDCHKYHFVRSDGWARTMAINAHHDFTADEQFAAREQCAAIYNAMLRHP